MRHYLLTALVALSLAGGATAQTAAAPDPAAKPQKPAKPRKICRTSMPTGSHMAVSECHTEAEWAAITAQNAGKAEDIQRQSQLALPQ